MRKLAADPILPSGSQTVVYEYGCGFLLYKALCIPARHQLLPAFSVTSLLIIRTFQLCVSLLISTLHW